MNGGCLCGAVRFTIDGKVSSIWFCHCSKCRKTTGSAFHPAALCRSANFRWQSGEDQISVYQMPSGYRTCFCRNCGSPVPSRLDEAESMILSVGTLDQDPESRPLRHIFAGSKAPWFEITDGLAQFDEHVPAPAEQSRNPPR